jgi:hypothetical protein
MEWYRVQVKVFSVFMRLERRNCYLPSCAGDFTVGGICEI